jgi:hypothetical protein
MDQGIEIVEQPCPHCSKPLRSLGFSITRGPEWGTELDLTRIPITRFWIMLYCDDCHTTWRLVMEDGAQGYIERL